MEESKQEAMAGAPQEATAGEPQATVAAPDVNVQAAEVAAPAVAAEPEAASEPAAVAAPAESAEPEEPAEPEPVEAEIEETLTRTKIISRLKAIVVELEGGSLVVGGLPVAELADEVEFELEYCEKDGEHKLEIELEW